MTEPATRPWTPETLRDPQAQAAAAAGSSVVELWPPDPDDRLHHLVAALDRLSSLKVFEAEFGHYGSGYASFVEVKLTRRDDSVVTLRDGGVETRGFGLLLSRLAPIGVLQDEFSDWRSGDHGAGSLPDRDSVTDLPVPGFPESTVVHDVLQTYGYALADLELLREPIASGVEPDTNLGDAPLTVFDAWFHWYD